MKIVKIQLSECSTQNPSESNRKNKNRIKKEEEKKKIEEIKNINKGDSKN